MAEGIPLPVRNGANGSTCGYIFGLVYPMRGSFLPFSEITEHVIYTIISFLNCDALTLIHRLNKYHGGCRVVLCSNHCRGGDRSNPWEEVLPHLNGSVREPPQCWGFGLPFHCAVKQYVIILGNVHFRCLLKSFSLWWLHEDSSVSSKMTVTYTCFQGTLSLRY